MLLSLKFRSKDSPTRATRCAPTSSCLAIWTSQYATRTTRTLAEKREMNLLALEEKTTPLPCMIPALHPSPVVRDQMLQRIQVITLTQAGTIFWTATGTRPVACRLTPKSVTPCHPLDQVIKQSGRKKPESIRLPLTLQNKPPNLQHMPTSPPCTTA